MMVGRLKNVKRWFLHLRVVVGFILLGLLIFYVDGSLLIDYWRDSQPKWLLITALFVLFSTLIGGYNLHLLLDSHESIPFHRFIRGYWIAWAVGLVVPGQVGDVASISVWLKRHGFQWHLSLGCTLLDKLISLFWMGGLGSLGLDLYLDAHYKTGHVVSLTIAGAISIFLLLWLLFRTRFQNNFERGVVTRTLHIIAVTIRQYKKQVLINFLLTGLKLVLIGAAFWCMFFALGHRSIDIVILVMLVSASSLVAYIPISFNGMGTVELAAIGLFSVLDIPDAAVISAFLAMRVTVLLLAWVPVSLMMVFPSSFPSEQ